MKKLKYISVFLLIAFIINTISPIISMAQYDTEQQEESTSQEEEDVDSTEADSISEEDVESTETESDETNDEINVESTSETTNEIISETSAEIVESSSDKATEGNTNTDEELTVAASETNSSEESEETSQDDVSVASTTSDEQIIEDGTYRIKAKVGSNKYVCVDNGDTTNGTNIELYSKLDVEYQEFEITYLSNGYYKITAVHSGKVVDVKGAGTTNKTNVQQYTSNNTNAQKWMIKDSGDGYYYIISACNNMYLDVSGANTSNGTNIQIYTGNSTDAQKFTFEEVEEIEDGQTIENGIYTIQSSLSTNRALEVADSSTSSGANIQIGKKSNVLRQSFYIEYIGDGYYSIETEVAGKMLDVKGAGTTNGTNVQQYTSNNTNAQKWKIRDAGDGYYYIISACNNMYLDVKGGSTSIGTNVQIYTGNYTSAQKFTFISIDDSNVYDGTYRISSALESSMALDVSKGSTSNKANIQIWSSTTVLQQKFELEYISDGYYVIRSVNSGKVLDVANAGTSSGTNVQQYKYNGTDAQLWFIEDTGDGYYYIISKCNGLYLDISGGETDDGTNVQVYKGNKTSAQKFSFDEVYFGVDVSYYQGTIDFDSLISSQTVDFMIARVGWYSESKGALQVDKQFTTNYKSAKNNDLPIGTYIYSYATSVSEAKTEANALVSYFNSNGYSFDLPVFYDIEDSTYQGSLSNSTRTKMCNAFCEILYNAGYNVGVYSSKSWFTNYINVDDLNSYIYIWVASWGTNDGYVPADKYQYSGDYDLWQYTSEGSISGISGDVDISIAFSKFWE